MMNDTTDISIELMGKTYQIKCPETEVNALQRAAQYLEEKMRLIRESGILSLDRVAIITALNVAHQLLTLEQQKNQHAHVVSHRLTELQNKIEHALAQNKQMELLPAE
jgi:cell division protein ZapA